MIMTLPVPDEMRCESSQPGDGRCVWAKGHPERHMATDGFEWPTMTAITPAEPARISTRDATHQHMHDIVNIIATEPGLSDDHFATLMSVLEYLGRKLREGSAV